MISLDLLFNFKEILVDTLSWLLPVIALACIILFFLTRFLPDIIPQAKIIHYMCIPIFSITLFFMGANWNQGRWLAELKNEQNKVEQAKQEQAKLNQELLDERKKVTEVLTKSSKDLRDANAKFIQELQKKDASVAGLLGTLDQVTREKYAALDKNAQLEYQTQLQSVIDFEKRCPTIPELYINKLNDRAKNPSKDIKR